MVRWERYIRHGERIGEVQRRREHESVVGWAKEETGKGLGQGARSDLENCLVTKDNIPPFCVKAGELTSELV